MRSKSHSFVARNREARHLASTYLSQANGGDAEGHHSSLVPRGSRKRRRVAHYLDTLFGDVEVIDTVDRIGRRVRVLEVDRSWQSAMFLDAWSELVFPYHHVFNEVVARRCPRTVLMLGGGAFSYPKYLLCHFKDVRVDVVEIDPVSCDIAHEWFFLDRVEEMLGRNQDGSQLRTFICDGRDFLELGAPDDPEVTYELIANDCFQATDLVAGLMTLESARLVHRRLKPGGAYVANVIGPIEGEDATDIHDVFRTFSQVFAHVWLLSCGEEDPLKVSNYVLVASDAPWDFADVIDVAGLEAAGLAPEGRVLTDADFD